MVTCFPVTEETAGSIPVWPAKLPIRLSVRTLGFQPRKTGSIPVWVTIFVLWEVIKKDNSKLQ